MAEPKVYLDPESAKHLVEAFDKLPALFAPKIEIGRFALPPMLNFIQEVLMLTSTVVLYKATNSNWKVLMLPSKWALAVLLGTWFYKRFHTSL